MIRSAAAKQLAGSSLRVSLGDVRHEPYFDNMRFVCEGRVMEATDAHARRQLLGESAAEPTQPLPAWAVEIDRFWVGSGFSPDPVTFWLSTPTLSFEPPSVVVERMWRGIAAAASGHAHDGVSTLVVVTSHSACLRAFTAAAFGSDPGEPAYLDQVQVDVLPDRGSATVTYRGASLQVKLPTELSPWTSRTWLNPGTFELGNTT
jgi:hypothetical protein